MQVKSNTGIPDSRCKLKAAMADAPSGDGTADSAHMADFALNLADQLITAFQQVADGAGEGEGAQEDGPLPSDNGAVDVEAEAKDGNDEWQDLEEDDELTESCDNGVMKEEGVGEENPESCISPLGSHVFVADSLAPEHEGQGNNADNMMFSPARVLNFDDSDGDDLPTMDQRFIPRGVFVQSEDAMDDRPELHGSEEVGYFSGTARTNMLLGDYSQNVRIIEGHDDLDLDRGAGYMSLTMRNHFLQTQMVQLPPFSDDPNASAHLYDSLEREEGEELYPGEDQDQEGEEDNAGLYGREDTGRDDVSDPRSADPLSYDVPCDQENSLAHGSSHSGQHQSRDMERKDLDYDPFLEDGEAGGGVTELNFLTHNPQDKAHEHDDGLANPGAASHVHQPASDEQQGGGLSSTLVVTLPKPSHSSASPNQDLGEGSHSQPGSVENPQQQQHQPSARPKQLQNKRQTRGGPAGSNGREIRNAGHRLQTGVDARAADKRAAAGGVSGRAGGRVAVGVGSSRQQGTGAHSQRPAVQGAAVTVAGISGGGDGDGAVAGSGSGSGGMAAAQSLPTAAVGTTTTTTTTTTLLSRTSSQGSLHSTTSSVGNSRVSGVGKESNSTRYSNQSRSARPYASIPGSQDAAAATRAAAHHPPHPHPHPHPSAPQRPPPPQRGQHAQRASATSIAPPTANPSHPSGRNTLSAPSSARPKSGGGAAAVGPRGANSRSAQLQQQQQQLQQEQQRLLEKQRQLQQQQQQQKTAGLGGMESPDGDHLVHHQAEAVVTQVGHLQQSESQQRQERQGGGGSTTSEVQGMEEVRSALQSMLRLPRDHPGYDQRGFDFADSASDLLMDRPPAHYQHEADASSLSGFRAQGPDDMPEMFESFPSFSFKMFSDMSGMSAASERSLHGENAYLRESLEKERYRRKHCEQQIQSLNAKLLEIQQQLAVAVSTDKRKDIMIDQLDKQLAKVVEGWKKREAEKDQYLALMTKEKSQIEDTLQKQQAMIDSFEKELANTVEELKQEKENSADLLDDMKEQLASATQSQHHAEEMLAVEKERAALMEKDWDQLKEARDLAEKRAQQGQDRLHQEQDSWYQREQELVHKIDQVKEANLKVMQMERVKLEEQTRKVEEMEERVHTAGTEVKRLEMDLDSAVREKESLKVEMALMEAKFESAQRSLQADLQATMEKEMTEQVSRVQGQMRQEQEEQAERHRQLVGELHQRHQRDLEAQIAALRQDLAHREELLARELADMESRVNEYRQENSALKQAKQKLESQRLEVLNKLQIIMQSQWNEAVSLLVTTPQRKTLNTSLLASLGGGGGGGGGSTMDGGGGGGGSLGHLGASTSAAPPLPNHFSVSSSGGGSQSTGAAAPSSAVNSRHPGQQGRSGQSSPLNNLSGSQSSHSSPPSPARPGASQSAASLRSQPPPPPSPQKEGGSGVSVAHHHHHHHPPGPSSSTSASTSTSFAAGGVESGVSLEDLTALLSDSHYLPPAVASSIHGVTHHGGLLVNAHHHHHHHPHHHHPSRPSHAHRQQQQQQQQPPPPHPPSQSQAFMIRPPQQSSRATGSMQEDLSLLSDVAHHGGDHHHHHHHSLEGESGGEGEGGSGRHRLGGGHNHGLGAVATDRGLELRDLEVDSQSSLSSGGVMRGERGGGLVGVGGGEVASGLQGGRDGAGGGGGAFGSAVSAYPPSMSPPVKQGRDGEQDSIDGSMLHETDRLNSSYREISRQLEEHQSRQRELQHYIKMLLDKPPGPGSDQPERDSIADPDAMDISFGSVAAELGLTEAAQAAQMNTELQRLQQLRDRQLTAADQQSQSARPKSGGGGGRKTEMNRHPSSQQSRSGGATTTQLQQTGVLAPQQLAEISRLLGQYSEDVEASQGGLPLSALQADPTSMAQVLRFLASLPQQQSGERGEKISSTKSSPRQQPTRRPREQQRLKKQADPRHHSVGPDTSLSSVSVATDRQDKSMASSTRSSGATSRKADRKSVNNNSASASSAVPAGKQAARSHSKEQQNPVWK
ncbi:uncharacterized protein LOC143288987 isoform X2 [Babylonia areolata]|uniref:uncharacterized protein LOC143288987 isoform X2 n=1 Tax=Babylonia areolata TaxID=304850 RepID=UPI003FD69BBE